MLKCWITFVAIMSVAPYVYLLETNPKDCMRLDTWDLHKTTVTVIL